jgi:hypothetical protein
MQYENQNNRTAEVLNIREQKAEKPNRRNTDVLVLNRKL